MMATFNRAPAGTHLNAEGHLCGPGGVPFTVAHAQAAAQRMKTAPETLTDRDVAILASLYGDDLATRAAEARERARAAAAPLRPEPPAPEPPSPAAPEPPAPIHFHADPVTKYDTDAFTAALDRFNSEPKSLSDDDLQQLAVVSPRLAGRALSRRAGYVEPASDRDRLNLSVGTFNKIFFDRLWPIIGTHRLRIHELLDRVAALEKQLAERGSPDASANSAIERRLAALEARPHLRYRGVWSAGETYACGDVATYGGSAWHANQTTKGVPPGSGGGEWTLTVKRGRDGKDAPAPR